MVYIPDKLSRKIIIRGISIDIFLEKIKTAIKKKDSNIILTTIIFRLKRRDKTTGLWIDSKMICIQILGHTEESLLNSKI